MTNHLKVPYILSGNIPELLGKFWFSPEISLPCQKELCGRFEEVQGGSGRFKMVVEKTYFSI